MQAGVANLGNSNLRELNPLEELGLAGIPNCYILDAIEMNFRLGDELDDYCIKCRRLTNHAIVSLMDGMAAKVRCRSCYGDHDYRREEIPPSKKDLKKAAEAL